MSGDAFDRGPFNCCPLRIQPQLVSVQPVLGGESGNSKPFYWGGYKDGGLMSLFPADFNLLLHVLITPRWACHPLWSSFLSDTLHIYHSARQYI